MSKRQFHRHTKRLETIFAAGGVTNRGITSDVSEGGLFIRTRYSLVPGSILELEIHLPDGIISRVKGIVKRSVRTPISTIKNGMGVEIIEKDLAYINLVKAIKSNGSEGGMTSHQLEYLILSCSNCKAKNKLAREKLSLNPRCGKCGTSLRPQDIV